MEYGQAYFKWQEGIGQFGAHADFFKVQDLFTDSMQAVLEFGCGGGFWLARIECSRKLGVEINPVARENCERLGVPVVRELAEVEDGAFDVCFSHHAMEHVRNPFETLQVIRSKLKPRGLLRLITPYDNHDQFVESDQNHHLYTWSVQNLGNILMEAGFKVLESRYLYHNWPRNYQEEYRKGEERFHKMAKQTARRENIRQVLATAQKE
jgi:SAM-dependent methyltransferase